MESHKLSVGQWGEKEERRGKRKKREGGKREKNTFKGIIRTDLYILPVVTSLWRVSPPK